MSNQHERIYELERIARQFFELAAENQQKIWACLTETALERSSQVDKSNLPFSDAKDLLRVQRQLTLNEAVYLLTALHDWLCSDEGGGLIQNPPITDWNEMLEDENIALLASIDNATQFCNLSDDKERVERFARYLDLVKNAFLETPKSAQTLLSKGQNRDRQESFNGEQLTPKKKLKAMLDQEPDSVKRENMQLLILLTVRLEIKKRWGKQKRYRSRLGEFLQMEKNHLSLLGKKLDLCGGVDGARVNAKWKFYDEKTKRNAVKLKNFYASNQGMRVVELASDAEFIRSLIQ